jgi:hypothetical protein
MFTEILIVIGIPVLAGIVLMFVRAATDVEEIGPEKGVDIGMDLIILSVGACGGIFSNATLVKKFGSGVPSYGIAVVLVCLVIMGLLAYIRRWQDRASVTWGKAYRNIALGMLGLVLTTSILILGYN